LILNAGALEVVMNIDAMLFKTALPEAARILARKSIPFKVKHVTGTFSQLIPWFKQRNDYRHDRHHSSHLEATRRPHARSEPSHV